MARILAVDDSESMRFVITHVLKTAGHEVTIESETPKALEIAKQGTFDIVLTDLRMETIDGLELTRQLRKLPQYKSVPILVITTDATEISKDIGKKIGVTGWLVKPIAPDSLLKVIEQVLSQ